MRSHTFLLLRCTWKWNSQKLTAFHFQVGCPQGTGRDWWLELPFPFVKNNTHTHTQTRTVVSEACIHMHSQAHLLFIQFQPISSPIQYMIQYQKTSPLNIFHWWQPSRPVQLNRERMPRKCLFRRSKHKTNAFWTGPHCVPNICFSQWSAGHH